MYQNLLTHSVCYVYLNRLYFGDVTSTTINIGKECVYTHTHTQIERRISDEYHYGLNYFPPPSKFMC